MSSSAEALTLAPGPAARAEVAAPLAKAERFALSLQLTLAMLAGGLVILALGWEWAFPREAALALLVAGAAAVLVAGPVMAAAWRSLKSPSLHGVTDLLVALAMTAAFAVGDLMTAALVPIVMIFAHVLEERSLIGSREAIRALGRLTQTTARRLRGGAVEIVAAHALEPGDRIELRAGDRAPADGIVRLGSAAIDAASLTGESAPAEASAGATILAGSIDIDGRLEVEVTRVGSETTLGRIIALMRDAERAKPPATRLLERYAGQYLALVLMAAGGTWFVTGDAQATLAVLVASCPCALVLAAPATSVAAIAVAARHGILVKGAAFLENLSDVDAVMFDKTGTLTTGELALTRIEAPDPEAALSVAAALGAASSHPLSRAAFRAGVDPPPAGDVREAGGLGVAGTVDGEPSAFGRPALFAALGVDFPPPPAHDGPVAGVSQGGRFLGWVLFADRLRPEAEAALAELRALGLTRQVLMTGDRSAAAQRVAMSLGIDEVVAEALPEQKMDRVRAEIRAGRRPMVVGDGINDGLALKVGAVGVAMGAERTDVALASADLVLMSGDLRRLATAIRLSRRCRRTIGANVAIGLGWTMVIASLAAAGALGPAGAVVAALLHNVSTFATLANAGRLLTFDETGGAAG
jgi:Zn2+/Cd2+-exporting ATPase